MTGERDWWSPEELRGLAYTPEQQAVIDAAVTATMGSPAYPWSRGFAARGEQHFVLVDGYALELRRAEPDLRADVTFEIVPVVVDGRLLSERAERLLHLQRCVRRYGRPRLEPWFSDYLPCTRLRAEDVRPET